MKKAWYIRIRGQVTGPFSRKDLMTFQAKGQLQAHHEVSQDQVDWQSPGSVLGTSAAATLAGLPPLPEQLTGGRKEGAPGSPRKVVLASACLGTALLGSAVTWGLTWPRNSDVERPFGDRRAAEARLEEDVVALQRLRDEQGGRIRQLEQDVQRRSQELQKRDQVIKEGENRLKEVQKKVEEARQAERQLEQEMVRLREESLRLQKDLAQAQARAVIKTVAEPRPDPARDARQEAIADTHLETGRVALNKAETQIHSWVLLTAGMVDADKQTYLDKFPHRRAGFEADRLEIPRRLASVKEAAKKVVEASQMEARKQEAQTMIVRAEAAEKEWQKVSADMGRFVGK